MKPIALPIVGDVSFPTDALYYAIGAVILTALLYIVWRSLGKGALLAILVLVGIIVFTMMGR